ncbi:MAG: DNA repair protein RecN [Saprospiraceae bacterium]|nr:DNA repair protein RecN [Saprospiraceae bacterium]
MLKSLSVKNYILIDEVSIDFSEGLNVLTGETGAGKSILLGALSLILGNRADKKHVYNSDEKVVIEGQFTVSPAFQAFFDTYDLDYYSDTIVRRELTASGKSRAFINDTPVTLDVLRSFSSQVVDLHRQHDSLSVTGTAFQQEYVDTYAGCLSKSKAFGLRYRDYRKQLERLEGLRAEQAKTTQELDFWQFQYNELEEAQLQAGELEEKEAQLKHLQHAEEIQAGLREVLSILEDEEHGTLNPLNRGVSRLQSLSEFLRQASGLAERFNSALLELEDISSNLHQLAEEVEQQPDELEMLTQRLDTLNRLLNKHHVHSSEELIEIWNGLGEKIQAVASFSLEITELEVAIEHKKQALKVLAQELDHERKKAIPSLEAAIKEVLQQVGMPNGHVLIDLKDDLALNAYGINSVNILFSANAGQAPQPLKSAASGGELSRLMLALKTLIAGKTTLPTLIFDEIDTGISGEVAVMVGKLLSKMAKEHQLILITHLPQIASRGNSHHFIYKTEKAGKTTSNIKSLNREERIVQIAEMLSGADPSDASLSAAKELLGLN